MIYKLYKTLDGKDAVMLISDEKSASFLCDENNTDYQEYLKWVAEGNTPEAADE